MDRGACLWGHKRVRHNQATNTEPLEKKELKGAHLRVSCALRVRCQPEANISPWPGSELNRGQDEREAGCTQNWTQLKQLSSSSRDMLKPTSLVKDLSVSCFSPARFLCPWGFPGKNTGVGCHFLPSRGSSQPRDQIQVSKVTALQADSLLLSHQESPILLHSIQ